MVEPSISTLFGAKRGTIVTIGVLLLLLLLLLFQYLGQGPLNFGPRMSTGKLLAGFNAQTLHDLGQCLVVLMDASECVRQL